MPEDEPTRSSDEVILARLGSAVLLCWKELPPKVQIKILNQADDMIGLAPIPGIRGQILRLLSRHGKL